MFGGSHFSPLVFPRFSLRQATQGQRRECFQSEVIEIRYWAAAKEKFSCSKETSLSTIYP